MKWWLPLRLRSFLAVTVLAGCGSMTSTITGPKLPSRGESCKFQVLTTPPESGFVEVGTIDIQCVPGGPYCYTEIGELAREITPYVCRAGGDAAIAWAGTNGVYLKATIIKLRNAPQPSPSPPPPSPVPAIRGCQFDTQCKGDRICVSGECQDPPQR